MSAPRRRRIPSRWWFAQMRIAAQRTPTTATQQTDLGVPYSQIALAKKLTANPNDDVHRLAEVSRGDWD